METFDFSTPVIQYNSSIGQDPVHIEYEESDGCWRVFRHSIPIQGVAGKEAGTERFPGSSAPMEIMHHEDAPDLSFRRKSN